MKINSNKFSLSFAGAFGVFYIICAVFVTLWPELSTKLLADLFHFSSENPFAMKVGLGAFISGLIQTVVYAYITGWIAGWALNRSAE